MKKGLFALIQFLPLSSFSLFAFWNGVPTAQRWIQAFELGAVAGVIQLMIIFFQPKPMSRLILGGNLYLMVGGLAAFTQQWWLLKFYSLLQESAIFLFIFAVGLISTFVTSAGFVAAPYSAGKSVKYGSYLLLAATAIALLLSLVFQGNRTWSIVIPIICLAVLQRFLAYRLAENG